VIFIAEGFTYKYLGDRDLRDTKILLDTGSYTASGGFSQQSFGKEYEALD